MSVIVEVESMPGELSFFKTSGTPLVKSDFVSFDERVLPLSGASYSESTYKGKTIRAWSVPDGHGKFYALAEILELQ